jgi:polar amino acid transport system permease protein
MTIWSWTTFWSLLTDFNFLAAAWTTIWAAAVAEFGGVLLGLLVAVVRLSRFRALSTITDIYVWAWRGSPLLVQLLLLYFGLPEIGLRLSVVTAGIIGLILNEGAFMSIVMRAGLLSVPKGQRDAARSLGLTAWQMLRFVELPQAARVVIPALGNQFNSMMKTTALLSVISFAELLRYTNEIVSETYRPLEPFAVAALYYLAMSSIWGILQAEIEARLARGSGRRGPFGLLYGALRRVTAWGPRVAPS